MNSKHNQSLDVLLDTACGHDKIPVQCEYCEKVFSRRKVDILSSRKRGVVNIFCSKTCSCKSVRLEKKCEHCNKIFDVPPSCFDKNKFCSKSCAAIVNNKKRAKTKTCKHCEKQYKRKVSDFCENKCRVRYNFEKKVRNWLCDGISPEKLYSCGKDSSIAPFIRKYLHELHNDQCQNCGWNKIHPVTNKVPLQIHHIDGNCRNNKPNNLELLCPNCHALTETFGALNKGGSQRNVIVADK